MIDEFSGCERRDEYGMEILDGTWGVTASLMRLSFTRRFEGAELLREKDM